MLRANLVAFVIALLTASNSRAQDPEDERKLEFEAGAAAAERSSWQESLDHFERARAIRETSGTVFNIARAQRELGLLEDAVATFRAYLDLPTTQDKAEMREEAQRNIDELEAELATRAEPEPPPAETRSAPPLVEKEPAQAAKQRSSDSGRLDLEEVAPWALVGTGGALLLASVVTGVTALNAQSDLEDACVRNSCDPKLASTRDRANDFATATDVLWVTALLSAGAGVAWLLVRDSEEAGGRNPVATVRPYGVRIAW